MPNNINNDDEVDYTEDPSQVWSEERERDMNDSDSGSDDSDAGHVPSDGLDSAEYMTSINELYSNFIKTVANLHRLNSSDTKGIALRKSLNLKDGALEVLVAHPEFIDLIEPTAVFSKQTEDEHGNAIPPYFTQVGKTSNAGDVLTKNDRDAIATILNTAVKPYMPDMDDADIELTDEDMNNLPSLSDEEMADHPENEWESLRIRKARLNKRAERMSNPISSTINTKVNSAHDSAYLIKANRFATLVDRMKAAVIMNAMNGEHVTDSETPENSSGAIQSFSDKIDIVMNTINTKYADTPEKIAGVLDLPVKQVNRVLANGGTAFGIPDPNTENGRGTDPEAYKYAKELIPWLYFLVGDYSGNTMADESVNTIVHGNDAFAMANGKLYDFGKGAENLRSLGKNPNVSQLITDSMEVIANKYPDISLDGDAMSVTFAGKKYSVSKYELAALMFLSTNKATLAKFRTAFLDDVYASHPDRKDSYDDALEQLGAIKAKFNSALGTGGSAGTAFKNLNGFATAVEQQIEIGKFNGKSGAVTLLQNELARKNAGYGIKQLALDFGFNTGSDQYNKTRVISLFGSVMANDDLVRGLADISTTDSASGESDGDKGNGGITTFIDPATTATNYVNNAVKTATTMSRTSHDFYEIPLDKKGQLLNARVSPEIIAPMFAERVEPVEYSTAEETQVYNELTVRMLHHILLRHHGNTSLAYDSEEAETAASVKDLTSDINSCFSELAKSASDAIECRNAWLKELKTVDGSFPAFASMVTNIMGRLVDFSMLTGTETEREVNRVIQFIVRQVKTNVLHVTQQSHDMAFSDTSVAMDGFVDLVTSEAGVNRDADAKSLRKTSKGNGSITARGAKAAEVAGATVTSDENGIVEVSFGDGSTFKFTDGEAAREYIRPSLVLARTDDESFYCLWIGLVPFTDYSSGTPENASRLDPRLTKYHQDKLNEYEISHGIKTKNKAVETSETYRSVLSTFCDSVAADSGRTDINDSIATLVPKIYGIVGIKDDKTIAGNVSIIVNKINQLITHTMKETPDAAVVKNNIASAVQDSYSLLGIFDGRLKQALPTVSQYSPEIGIILKYLNQMMASVDAKKLNTLVSSPEYTDAAASIKGENIKTMFDVVKAYGLMSGYGSLDANGGMNIVGDPSLYRGNVSAGDRTVVSPEEDEDNNELFAELRNGMHDGIEQTGGELSDFAEGAGLMSLPMDTGSYESIFGDRYPMLGAVKTGEEPPPDKLLDGDSLCGIGLNSYGMNKLLAALDSAHAEVNEVKERYSERSNGIEMSMLHGRLLVSYLIDTFYDLFTATSFGKLIKNDLISKKRLIENAKNQLIDQAITRCRAIVNDSMDTVMIHYLTPCVDALVSIAGEPDISSKLTGIANVIVYMESINPNALVQGTNTDTSSIELNNGSTMPSDTDVYSKAIGSKFADKKASGAIEAARNAFRSSALNIYGASTPFGQAVANMYHILDRGKTEGFRSSLDPFSRMVDRLVIKANDSRIPVHSGISNSDLMTEVIAAIIDDEKTNSAVNGMPYAKVAEVVKSVSAGQPVDSFYLQTSNPEMNDDGTLNLSKKISVSYNSTGSAIKNGSAGTPATFNTLGELAVAINGGKKSSEAPQLLVTVADPSERLTDDDGNISPDAIDSLVRAVRTAVVERLFSAVAQDSDDINARMNALFREGAASIKTGNGDFVSLSLIMMLLYTRSIDKSRFVKVNAAADRMRGNMRAAQADRMASRVASIDPLSSIAPSLASAGKENSISDAGLIQAIKTLFDYGAAFISHDEDKMNSIASGEEAQQQFGNATKDFLDGFTAELHRMNVDAMAPGDELDSKIAKTANSYLSRALRSNSKVSGQLNETGNSSNIKQIADLLAKYRMKVGPNQASIPSSNDRNANPEAEAIRHSIHGIFGEKIGDNVLDGFMQISLHKTDATWLRNMADNYVGQLLQTDPILRNTLLSVNQDKEDLITLQGATPLDDIRTDVGLNHASAVETMLTNAATGNVKVDSKHLADYGIDNSGVIKFRNAIARCNHYLDEVCDSANQYYTKKASLDNYSRMLEGPGLSDEAKRDLERKVKVCQTAMKKHNPNGGDNEGQVYKAKTANLINFITNEICTRASESKTLAAGIRNDAPELNKAVTLINNLPGVFGEIYGSGNTSRIVRDTKKRITDPLDTIIASMYANGTSIYNKYLTKALGNAARNATLTLQRMTPDDCIKVLKALAKIDDQISVNAAVPGNTDEMFMIYGIPRTRDEAAAIVNASINDFISDHSHDMEMPDADTLLTRATEQSIKPVLVTLDGYLKRHVNITTGSSIEADEIAPFVMAILARAHKMRSETDGYSINIAANGTTYSCIIPMNLFVDSIRTHMPDDMDSNEWQAILGKISMYTQAALKASDANSPILENDPQIAKVTKLGDDVYNDIKNKCQSAVESAGETAGPFESNGIRIIPKNRVIE